MRERFAALAFILLVGAFTKPLGAGQARPVSAAPQLPPLSYVCIMPGDEAVLEDKPGKCPRCGMELVPVRLDSKWWCPTHQTLVVKDGPGKCPIDGKDLVQVTLSEFWTCADKPTEHLLEPGKCSDGQPRKIAYGLRAHGDHNPRHGGQFFMAEDQWHHVEGTNPSTGLFRAFFYDNYTQPMAPQAFSGHVDRDNAGKLESVPLTLAADGKTLQARFATPATPFKLKAWIKFSKETREQAFDFTFDKLSIDSAAPAATPAAAPARPPATTTARPPAATTSGASRTTPAAAPPPPAAPVQAPRVLDTPLNVPPALADALDESKLPNATPALLTELSARLKSVSDVVDEGNLSQVWLPATATKTAALVLETRASNLPERQRTAISMAVKRVVTAAWELDQYSDLGNKDKIVEAFGRLSSAVTDLKAAYGTR